MKRYLRPAILIACGTIVYAITGYVTTQPDIQTIEYKTGGSTVCDGRTVAPGEPVSGEDCYVIEGEVGPTGIRITLITARIIAVALVILGVILLITTLVRVVIKPRTT